jgi:photosystem II stability/assembly factor-like uncharacterized protein
MQLRRSIMLFAALATTIPSTGHLLAQDRTSAGLAFDAVSFLKWREIGPAVVGGRVADIAVDESNTRIIYVGTATGGVWKSTNHGTTWDPIFTDKSTSSIGDVTLAPSNPNIVWVGTGEPQNRQSSPWGDGVFKSMDGGRSWEQRGLRETLHIARIVIHPRDPDIVYVAAVGGLWAPNPERGVFKTTDGGETWEHVLSVDDDTGAIDLAMDPNDPNTLFVGMYQRRRTAWGFNGGGPGSGIYRTFDGGSSWDHLGEGLPEAEMGRIGLDIYRRDGNEVFAVVQAKGGESGVYRSSDRGDTWEKTSDTNPRPMYYSQIRVDPNNPERVYLGGSNLMRSHDGGRTFTADGAANVHLDHHALWIDPNNSDHLLIGSDGGVSVSWDGSDNWRFYDNLPIAQFYEIGISRDSGATPYTVCGGLQDNGSWCGPTNTLDSQGIRNADWINVGGGDGFYVQIDPLDAMTLYAESQNGFLGRRDLRTGEQKWILPTPDLERDEGAPPRPDFEGDDEPNADERAYRANWNTPVHLSAHDRNTIYVGYQMLLRSRDKGESWEQISPDLTYDMDRAQMPIMGALPSEDMLSRNDGTRYYSTLTTIGESPINRELIYTGSDDGRVMVTRDGGATWTDLTPNLMGLPQHTYVSRVVASAHREGRVYATFDGHYSGDFAAYVFRSDDYGTTWTRITNGLPSSSVNIIAEHEDTENLLFVGNEVGLYASTDKGGTWSAFMNGLPVVPVDDIKIHPEENDLVLGTHGRGIWVMDDIGPLEEVARTPELLSAPHLFAVGLVVDWRTWRYQEWTGRAEFRRPNPTNGASIRYWIPETAAPEAGNADTLDIRITTAAGVTVRKLEGPSTPGAHEVSWDFRIDPPFVAEPGNGSGGGGFFGSGVQGPKVMPAVYQIQIERGGTTLIGDMIVRLDPRIPMDRPALRARQDALMAVYHLQKPEHEARETLKRLKKQIEAVRELIDSASEVPDEISDEIEAIEDFGEEIDDDLDDLGISRARFMIESSTTAPTEDQLRGIDRMWEDAPGVIERVNELITVRMPALYGMLDNAGVRADPGEAIEMPRRGGD